MSTLRQSTLADETLHEWEELLRAWVPHQQWYATKEQAIEDLRIVARTTLQSEGPRIEHLLLAVTHGGVQDTYQVPVTLRDDIEPTLEHVRIGHSDGAWMYDACYDKQATAMMLGALDASLEFGTATGGRVSFHRGDEAALPLGELSTVLPGDHPNASIVYGDEAVLKIFRRVQPGNNPDLEIHALLSAAGSPHVARLLAWVDGAWPAQAPAAVDATAMDDARVPDADGLVHGNLGMARSFLTTATDGWHLATASVRDLYAEGDLRADEVGGDFAAEAFRLGQATAEVHATMRDVLPTAEGDAQWSAARAARMQQRLDLGLQSVPGLAEHEPKLRAMYAAFAAYSEPVPIQRIHGELDLENVLRTVLGWKLIDFEGDPNRPLDYRAALDSPLRDIASLTRSLDYAARHLHLEDHPNEPQIAYRAREWSARNRTAFCEGYAKSAGTDPRDVPELFTAYEADKAVTEVMHEAKYRPHWVGVPLSYIELLES